MQSLNTSTFYGIRRILPLRSRSWTLLWPDIIQPSSSQTITLKSIFKIFYTIYKPTALKHSLPILFYYSNFVCTFYVHNAYQLFHPYPPPTGISNNIPCRIQYTKTVICIIFPVLYCLLGLHKLHITSSRNWRCVFFLLLADHKRQNKHNYLNNGWPTRWHLLYYLLLNMFQTLIRPSLGASEYLLCCVGW